MRRLEGAPGLPVAAGARAVAEDEVTAGSVWIAGNDALHVLGRVDKICAYRMDSGDAGLLHIRCVAAWIDGRRARRLRFEGH